MRTTQLDRAIESLKEKREAILAKTQMEVQALEHAIQMLLAQKVKAKVSRPRPVAAMAGEKVG